MLAPGLVGGWVVILGTVNGSRVGAYCVAAAWLCAATTISAGCATAISRPVLRRYLGRMRYGYYLGMRGPQLLSRRGQQCSYLSMGCAAATISAWAALQLLSRPTYAGRSYCLGISAA